MTVVIHSDSGYAVTAPSMTCMISLTYMLLVDFISNFSFAFSLDHNREGYIKYVGGVTT